MSKKLVIVESPSKAKTIKKYLGSTYKVEASMGHIIDLPKSQMGVDVEHDFEPRYITIRGKGSLLSKLKKEAKGVDKIYLATDPDREGEAISWHLAHALGIEETSPCRVTFNEITKSAVQKAINEPRSIDQSLVDAQQARRVLDRIVGYRLSPILWKKVKKGLSAGRVQSVATRLICDREDEIEAFVPQEYWTITAELTEPKSKKNFKANYYGEGKKKAELKNEAEAKAVSDAVKGAPFVVSTVKTTDIKKSPAPPFTTSTMQQEASRKINFQSRKTMQTAQTLYEGVDVKGAGTVGLITYMRTDSTRIAQEAQYAARDYITENYGASYAPKSFRNFKSRKNAQDAHEAIRPTDVTLTPARVKESLTNDQYKLYKLIWERFVASQMENAVVESTVTDIDAAGHTFRASGSKVKFDGFMKVYIEGTDTEKQKETALPPLVEGEELKLKNLENKQHFTQPPARYTEASLVKALEEDGIGRPSTFAPTITTILARGYVTREKKSLIPTELGRVTTNLLKENFKDIVDVDFTANMETQLDEVESGEIPWKSIVKEFYGPFDKEVKRAEEEISHVQLTDEVSDVRCEKCGRMMVYKMGRYGKFLACPGFPECRNAKPIRKETGVNCPKCGKPVLVKKSKTGRTYYGCEDNPKCDFMTWDMPIAGRQCPKCGGVLLQKNTRGAKKIVCANENCDYEETGGKKSES
ncbi:MAG TPA: type I DNA topoisomerase [Candidatus Aphodoplasma excrementigallinarum]|uniref:DNA topoisomerase 1 n=1 Tax=Candidatus Aphodoplasma excrementigallinarum TaxID=2840673 RepID=A0A9D1NHM7_9FIRM|nr:type I DNA topoisomerase [Candidatus Aphodoplasma excrementigallinarum]